MDGLMLNWAIFMKMVRLNFAIKKALIHYKLGADFGNAEAAFRVGVKYVKGVFKPETQAKDAKFYLRIAAKKNHPDAQYVLSRLHYENLDSLFVMPTQRR